MQPVIPADMITALAALVRAATQQSQRLTVLARCADERQAASLACEAAHWSALADSGLAAAGQLGLSVSPLDGVTPWQIVKGFENVAGVRDANGKTLFLAPGQIARRAVAALNMVECAYRKTGSERR